MSNAADEMRQGNVARALTLMLKSADDCRKIGVPGYEAHCLTSAAIAADAAGMRAEAIGYAERADSMVREPHN